ncbi:Nicotinate-nucleotide--dimethylbenzimidazole phosphoribosyltransferase [hydrothermal vent metagenome]|uniref:Nicotinate-nucleotide--dimethylbenzimidazole phosphoribosyltransferase n=1 Tax=hydrothermal vent metagenome TaxID=652676 RepID=A0A3B1ADN1_9ZZZZ
MTWFTTPAAGLNADIQNQATQHQAILTKPAGSLGQLENIAIQFAAMQSSNTPKLNNIYIAVFAADHGVMDENVSAFPQAVTAEMVRNFSRGGAAISVLAKQLKATLDVVDMGTANELETLPGVLSMRVASATHNFCTQAAMSAAQCYQALEAGKVIAEKAKQNEADIFIGGEMGIGNTTTSAALASALLQQPVAGIVGPGTGLDDKGIQHKIEIIEKALAYHKKANTEPLKILENLGGFEIIALVGAYIRAAQLGLPCVIDGFIASVAALFATHLSKGVEQWFVYSHQSAEPGHRIVLQALKATPLLNIGMRLGEGSAAASVVCLLKNALALHNNMATFEQAGVSDKS